MELVNLGEMHVHMREKFENDPCWQFYERVYTSCAIQPNATRNPSKFYISILSEAVKNLQDPDYKNYRYKFISRRFYANVVTDIFKEYAESMAAVMSQPEYEQSYIVAHTINHGVAVQYQLDELMKLFEKTVESGNWKENTSFSFSLVSCIHNVNN